MTVIGFRKTEFTTQDNKHITGYNIYGTYPLEKGEGTAAERLFMTTDKLMACGYNPVVGDEIRIEYNRYGKPAAIHLAKK